LGVIPRPLRSLPAVIACALALGASGCGEDSDSGAAAESGALTKSPQRFAEIPPGWEREANFRIGYTIGLPPDWRLKRTRGLVSLVRSPDHLVAISISADRTGESLALPIEQSAIRTLSALPGFRGGLEPGPARPFGGTDLDAVQVEATGLAGESGVRQRVRLVVLRREDHVTYTVIVAENAKDTPPVESELALRIVRTIRDNPIGPGVRPEAL
jgi:hypothetical protein